MSKNERFSADEIAITISKYLNNRAVIELNKNPLESERVKERNQMNTAFKKYIFFKPG